MGDFDSHPISPTQNLGGRLVGKKVDEKAALVAFESYFLGEMLKRTAPENPTGLFDGGDAGRMYQDHLYEEMARVIAEQGDFGLAKQLKGHLGGTDDVEASTPESALETEEEDGK